MKTWYILYDGTSPDGRGDPVYLTRTTDPEIARKFLKDRNDPHSLAKVVAFYEKTEKHFNHWNYKKLT